jgi:hypothetical protein
MHKPLKIFSSIKLITLVLLGLVPSQAGSVTPMIDPINLIDADYGAGAGSFELGVFVNHSCGICNDFMPLAPGSTTMTGWTVGGPGDGVDWGAKPTFNADTGNRFVDLQHYTDSSIATVINTIPGQVYQISFAAAAYNPPSNANLGSNTGVVSAGSLVNQSFSAPYSAMVSTQVFAPFTFQFTALGNTTTVKFTGTGASNFNEYYGPLIDTVSVNAIHTAAINIVPFPDWLLPVLATVLVGIGRHSRRETKRLRN